MIATEIVTFYNPETDTMVEVHLSPEDAIRAKNDMIFATNIMNSALKENSPSPPTTTETEEENVEEHEDVDVKKFLLNSAAGFIYRWSTPCVLLLLETYKTIEHKFNSGKQSQKKIWKEVSQLLKVKGHVVTGPQCAAKLRSLKKSYKSVKDHNNKSGNDKRTWQFFEIMDEIFAKKAWCTPVAVASSTGLSEKKDKGSNPSTSKASNLSPSKTSVRSLLAKRIRQKEEHEEAKTKRHKQRMVKDERLLAAIEKLPKN